MRLVVEYNLTHARINMEPGPKFCRRSRDSAQYKIQFLTNRQHNEVSRS